MELDGGSSGYKERKESCSISVGVWIPECIPKCETQHITIPTAPQVLLNNRLLPRVHKTMNLFQQQKLQQTYKAGEPFWTEPSPRASELHPNQPITVPVPKVAIAVELFVGADLNSHGISLDTGASTTSPIDGVDGIDADGYSGHAIAPIEAARASQQQNPGMIYGQDLSEHSS